MNYKVLLVDDEEIVCQGLTRFVNWEELGYEVTAMANSAAQALVYMESAPVDLVISDIRMPVQDGLRLIEIIQSEYPVVRTIMLSGYGEFKYARQAMRFGASDFLTKPVNFGELKKLLGSMKKELDEERRENRSRQHLRQSHLNQVLTNLAKGYAYSDLEEQAELAGLPLDQEYRLIRIQCQRLGNEQTDPTAAKEWMNRLASEAANGLGQVWIFNNERYEISCVWMPAAQEGRRMTDRYLKALSDSLERHHLEGVMGISAHRQRWADLKEAYLEAGRALQYALLHDDRKIVHYREVDQVLQTDYRIDEKLAAEIMDLLAAAGQWGRVQALIRSTMDMMIQDQYNLQEIQAFNIQILFLVSQHLHSINSFKNSPNADQLLFKAIRDLLHTVDVAVMKDMIEDYLDRIKQELSAEDPSAKPVHLIDRIQRHIDEHYAEDVSLTTLSNVFYIHPIYLSRLFKEKTGMNFLDYVTEVRIARAKEMLRDPAFKVYEIGQMVGYDSPRYFSKLFKSLTGMTPREYKENQFIRINKM